MGSVIAATLIVIVVLLALPYIRACSPQPPPPEPGPTVRITETVTVQDIRFIAELATVEYRVIAEIQRERFPENVFGKVFKLKELVLMLVYADVKAGFDLSELPEDSLRVRGTKAELILPPPEILSVTLDHTRTHVVYYEKSPVIRYDINWVEEVLEAADNAVRQEAIEMQILDKAAAFGKIYFENELRAFGYTDVEVVIK